eukprot:jgi/Bigna1/130965/aug1.13_g5673
MPWKGWKRFQADLKGIGIFPVPSAMFIHKSSKMGPNSDGKCSMRIDGAPLLKARRLHASTVTYLTQTMRNLANNGAAVDDKYQLIIEAERELDYEEVPNGDNEADKLQQNKQTYSDSELRDLVSYAYARGIRIVPEIDLPGHAKGWGGDLAMCCNGVRSWGIPLKINRKATYVAIESVLQQVNGIFPDPLIHLGGDEGWIPNPNYIHYLLAAAAAVIQFSSECFHRGISTSCGKSDPETCDNLEDCLYYFETQLKQILNRLPFKRSVIRWMDLVESHQANGVSPLIMHPELFRDTWGMSWRGFNEMLILGGVQEHWGSFLPKPLTFPLLLTSEQWYVPPHPTKQQQNQNFGCERSLDMITICDDDDDDDDDDDK